MYAARVSVGSKSVYLWTSVCVCCDQTFRNQPCLDTRHLERVAVATKEKRLEADTVGSKTPTQK